MRCRQRCLTWPDRLCIDVFSGMASAACRLWKATSRSRKNSSPNPICYFHIDIAEVRTEAGRLYLFVAIDRTYKFAYAELHEDTNKMVAAQFLRHLVAAVPDKIHTVLTDISSRSS
jgi:transposase-like protein